MDTRGAPFALARVEFDRVDRVAEFFGEGVAEFVQDELVLRLQECATDPVDVFCPPGGMALVLVPVDSPATDDLAHAAWALTERLSAAIDVGISQVSVGCTVGIAEPGVLTDRSVAGLINAASTASRRAAALGSRRAVVFEGAHETSGRRGTLDRSLFEALTTDQILAWYQPQVRLADGALAGVEALARWNHPLFRTVAAEEFVPEAQWSGLIRAIDSRVVAQGMQAAATWPSHVGLVVNLSSASLDHPRVAGEIADCLRATGLSPQRVRFAIGAMSHARNLQAHLRRLSELRELGVRLSLGDWGAAHAFVDVLGDGLFDEVRIDRPWVRGWRERRSGEALAALVALARAVGLDTVIVGIETEDELAAALASGCPVGQGDHLYPALPENELRDLLHHG
jgi:predicted signal transduction protein with EAL and GGDEF domain